MDRINEISEDFAKIELQEGLVFITFKTDVISSDIAKKIVSMRLKLVGNDSFPVLADGRGVKSIDKEARDIFSSEDAGRGVTAGALLSNSVFTTFLANFFLKVSYKKSKIPSRLFTDEEEAKKWLKQ